MHGVVTIHDSPGSEHVTAVCSEHGQATIPTWCWSTAPTRTGGHRSAANWRMPPVTAAVLTPFTTADAVKLGNRLWRKKVLPVGDVEYKGRLLHFTRNYLGQLAAAFTSRAY